MTRLALGVLCAAAVVLPASAQKPARLRLIRCATGSDAPCVHALVPLGAAARLGLGGLDSSAEAAAWHGELAGTPLAGPGVATIPGAVSPTRLLVLIDRGPAMGADAMAFARIALQSWLETLDSSAIGIAIVGFDGPDVAPGIANAPFLALRRARASLDSIPAPSAHGHAPLYSAVLLGAGRLSVAPPGAGAGALVVITMGHNDVGRGRTAAGLLAGDSGLRIAGTGTTAARQRTWIMTLGPATGGEDLATLAGPAGTVVRVAADPNAIAARLAAIGREFPSARALTFGIGTIGTAALARISASGSAGLRVGTANLPVVALAWRPPLVALPVFQGVAAAGSLSGPLREILLIDPTGSSDRPLVLLLVAVIVASIWTLAARFGGPTAAVAAPLSRGRGANTRTAITTVKPVESAPRKPEDITHQTARRTALRR